MGARCRFGFSSAAVDRRSAELRWVYLIGIAVGIVSVFFAVAYLVCGLLLHSAADREPSKRLAASTTIAHDVREG
ncbi:Uncharacterised protein [Dermatophilus congolensis]|uniref:Uncharacterized protein n=1 Tax=Dermatophilus congolensis TaxID=1863 RepID=A0A239VTZ5_9MICO|nr:Uncharacterised protein [Dermatophilus congolensis]